MAAGALTVWACYWFSYGKVPAWNLNLPAPEFFDGISVAMRHNQEGHSAYLFGATTNKGWWYFFPVALASCLGAAFFSLILWVESPTAANAVLFGVSSALAALAKFTALGFLPAAALL